jgi:CBS domain-containing protein
MHENKIGSIVILDNITNDKDGDRLPIGIITERDIVRLIGLYDKSSSLSRSSFVDRPVSDVMSTPLTTINPNSSLSDAIQTMRQKDIRRLPVVDNRGKMLGIVTSKDRLLRKVHRLFVQRNYVQIIGCKPSCII